MKNRSGIIKGLFHINKYIKTKYLYDEKGNQLYKKINLLEKYYLGSVEAKILNNNINIIIDYLLNYKNETQANIKIVEFGSGDGSKLLNYYTKISNKIQNCSFVGVDLSRDALNGFYNNLKDATRNCNIETISFDFTEKFDGKIFKNHKPQINLYMFLGGNIGNLEEDQRNNFLSNMSGLLSANDYLLIGFDMKKNPLTIYQAYDCSNQIINQFFLNLLDRLNREFYANFNLSQFFSYFSYDPSNGEGKVFLVSEENQVIQLKKINESISFNMWETIYLGLTKKFDVEEIYYLANKFNFKIIDIFEDADKLFQTCLLIKK